MDTTQTEFHVPNIYKSIYACSLKFWNSKSQKQIKTSKQNIELKSKWSR